MQSNIMMGRLTRDPETVTTTRDTTVVKFSVAVNRKFADENGERKADFFQFTAFGKTAEFISKYFTKGRMILVQFRMQNNNYEKDGVMVYSDQMIVESVNFCGDKAETNAKKESDGEFITVDDTTSLPF